MRCGSPGPVVGQECSRIAEAAGLIFNPCARMAECMHFTRARTCFGGLLVATDFQVGIDLCSRPSDRGMSSR